MRSRPYVRHSVNEIVCNEGQQHMNKKGEILKKKLQRQACRQVSNAFILCRPTLTLYDV